MSRLGGGKTSHPDGWKDPEELYIHTIGSMEQAVERVLLAWKAKPFRKKHIHYPGVEKAMLNGDSQLEGIVAEADEVIDEAIIN